MSLAGFFVPVVAAFALQAAQPAPHERNDAGDLVEMIEMFEADQAIRFELMAAMKPGEDGKVAMPTDIFERMSSGDRQRYERTLELFNAGALETGLDYYNAAFIFQHGGEPADYLRAHHAAVVSIAKGYDKSTWISAASLDRYLDSIGQEQIYGTQSTIRDGVEARKPTQAGVITDAERARLGVPPMAAE